MGVELLFAKGTVRPEGFDFTIQGDLNQMGDQRSFLASRGMDVRQSDVYPVLKAKDVKTALTLLWENRVNGWWHYQEKMAELGICTKEEWKQALSVQCRR